MKRLEGIFGDAKWLGDLAFLVKNADGADPVQYLADAVAPLLAERRSGIERSREATKAAVAHEASARRAEEESRRVQRAYFARGAYKARLRGAASSIRNRVEVSVAGYEPRELLRVARENGVTDVGTIVNDIQAELQDAPRHFDAEKARALKGVDWLLRRFADEPMEVTA